MTSKHNKAPLLYHIKLCASFHIHRWIQTEVTVRKRSIQVKIGYFFSCVTLENNRAPLLNYIQALCIISKPWVNSNWSYSLETLNSGQNLQFFVPCDLEIWWMTLKNNRAPLLSNIKLCASFHHHKWIQTGVTVRKRLRWVLTSDLDLLHQALCIISKPWVNSNWSYSPEMLNSGQNQQFFVPCDLEIWWMTLNKANLRDLKAATSL